MLGGTAGHARRCTLQATTKHFTKAAIDPAKLTLVAIAGMSLRAAVAAVAIAINPEDGLKLFQAGKFDVVVTDYRMPLMDGTELIRQIRLLDPNARIIMLSGFVEPLGLTELNTGADAVISKSANEPAHLTRSVKRLLNRGLPRLRIGEDVAFDEQPFRVPDPGFIHMPRREEFLQRNLARARQRMPCAHEAEEVR